MLRRLPRTVWLGGGVLTTGMVATMAYNDWDVNSLAPVRLGRAVYAAGAIAADYRINVYGRTMPDDLEEAQSIWATVHKRSAERLLDLCKANRGVFVKVGQHLGALDYLLPREYVETLKTLHSQAPASSLDEVYQVIKEDLNVQNVEDLFCDFDTDHLGAASLAQVYKAKLRSTGETIAVKVQHANVRAHSNVDIKTMEVLVRTAAWMFPDFKLLWLLEETKKNLPNELNFLMEGQNADQLRGLMAHCRWLKIPKIHWDLSTERVLVMEYCEGGQIDDLEYINKQKINTSEVAEKIGTLYSEMIFSHGFVHCDPHPGNLLVRKTPDNSTEICLIDHGLYTSLSPEFRYNYSQFWLSIIRSNVEGMKKYGMELGVGELYPLFACMVTARSWESLSSQDGVSKKLTPKEEEQIRKSIGGYLPQISEILERVPRPMILIFKTNDLIRGIEHALKTQKTMKSFTTMSKFCVKTVYSEELRKCSGVLVCLKYMLLQQIELNIIRAYEVYIWFKSVFLSPFFETLL